MELFNQKSCLFLKPLKYTYMSFKKYIPVYIPTVGGGVWVRGVIFLFPGQHWVLSFFKFLQNLKTKEYIVFYYCFNLDVFDY